MDRAGDPGIVTMYASSDAGDAIVKAQEKASSALQDGDAGGMSGLPGQLGDQAKELRTLMKDFEGAAGVIRFDDGAVEAEFTTKGLPQGVGTTSSTSAGADASTLPGTTAAVFAVAFKDGWFDDYRTTLEQLTGGSEELDQAFADAEQQTGLTLPEDIETLLGDGLSLSVDAGADLDKLVESPDPESVPAGLRIYGDADEITAVIDKLKAAAGPQADIVKVGSGDGLVAVGLDQEYVDRLLEKGDLGSSTAFDSVVPEADRATGLFYVNFDAGDGWAEKVADLVSHDDPEVRANVAPLDALGVSGWLDDDEVQHGLLRLTTD